MMEKIFIVGLIVCSFFVISISPVIAAETHTVPDDTGDVIDYISGNIVSGKNDIDIKEVNCTQDGKHVELQLVLVDGGEIQNSDLVMYWIFLVTSENRYDIIYSNDSYSVTDFEGNEIEGVDYSGGGTGTLKVSFDLSNVDEQYIFVFSYASEEPETGDEAYLDSAPDYEEIPTVTATMPSENLVVGEQLDFQADVEGVAPSYTWNWDFGDEEISNEQNPTHTYDKAGNYKAIVLVTDNNGYSDIYYETINITAADGGDHNGGNNGGTEEGESSNSGLILFVVVIAVIFIAGIAVVVYIIRR